MVGRLHQLIRKFYTKRINGIDVYTRYLTLRALGTIKADGYARLGLGNEETSDFFRSRDYSYLNNQGTIRLGNHSKITSNFRIANKGVISIGASTYVNPNSIIRIEKGLTIGNECAVSWGCTFIDTNHHKINGTDTAEEIVIGNKVWIGANSIILKGVVIGDNCIVAAGSVVTQKFGSNLMIGGVPAKIIKEGVNWEM